MVYFLIFCTSRCKESPDLLDELFPLFPDVPVPTADIFSAPRVDFASEDDDPVPCPPRVDIQLEELADEKEQVDSHYDNCFEETELLEEKSFLCRNNKVDHQEDHNVKHSIAGENNHGNPSEPEQIIESKTDKNFRSENNSEGIPEMAFGSVFDDLDFMQTEHEEMLVQQSKEACMQQRNNESKTETVSKFEINNLGGEGEALTRHDTTNTLPQEAPRVRTSRLSLKKNRSQASLGTFTNATDLAVTGSVLLFKPNLGLEVESKSEATVSLATRESAPLFSSKVGVHSAQNTLPTAEAKLKSSASPPKTDNTESPVASQINAVTHRYIFFLHIHYLVSLSITIYDKIANGCLPIVHLFRYGKD